MIRQKGFTTAELVIVLFSALWLAMYVGNAIELTSCDFEANYKCEVLHGIGVIVPPAAIVTFWLKNDDA